MEGVYSIRMHVLAFHPDSASYNLYSSGSEDESQVDTFFLVRPFYSIFYMQENTVDIVSMYLIPSAARIDQDSLPRYLIFPFLLLLVQHSLPLAVLLT